MMTKFNKDMYARMRGKKDEPLSAIGAKTVHVTERGAPISSVPPSTPTLGTVGIASPTPSIEELTSQHKRPRTGDKQKEKVDSRSSSVWDDAGVALARAQDVFNADDLKVFSGVSANKVVGRHLHKLVQVPMQIYILHSSLLLSFFFFFFFFPQVLGESLHLTSEYLAQEAKVKFGRSHVMTLEADNLKLKKDLIAAMNKANLAKEKVKTFTDELRTERQLTLEKDEPLMDAWEKIKGIAAKAVEGF